LEEERGRLSAWAGNPKADDQRREAAIRALVDLGGPRSLEQIERLTDQKQPYAIRRQAIAGLATLDLGKAAARAGDFLRQPPGAGEDPALLFAAFLERKDGAVALANVLAEKQPAADAAKIGLRVLVERGVPAPALYAALHKAAGQGGARRKLEPADMKRWIALVQRQGDPSRGEAVFRRASLGCYQCHALGGAGGRVGPDLSGIGTSAQLDYLIESVFLPSKVVREGYTTAHVTTNDGRTFSGVVQRESAKELVLKDATRDEIVIAAQDIEDKRVGGSLMPDGLDQSLNDAELADLFRFLSELGKPGPFGVTHQAVARRWQVLSPLPASLATLDDKSLGKILREDSALAWKPAYAKVSGHLPLDADQSVAVVRCQLDVVTPGNIALCLNDVGGVTLWVDGNAAPADQPASLKRGVHDLVLRVEASRRKEHDLRLELVEAAGAKGQARFVDGR
jgi:putative heme-binding domain-containing protein